MAAYVAERLEAAFLLPRDDQGNAQYPVTDERPRLRQLLRMARDQWTAVKQPLFPREMLRVEIAGGGVRHRALGQRRRPVPDIAAYLLEQLLLRSEARRVGHACVRTCRSRWSPSH